MINCSANILSLTILAKANLKLNFGVLQINLQAIQLRF